MKTPVYQWERCNKGISTNEENKEVGGLIRREKHKRADN